MLLVYIFNFFPNKISEKQFKIFHECFLLSKSLTFFISVILPSGTTRFPANKQKKEKQFFFSINSRDLCGPPATDVLTPVTQPQLHQVKDKTKVREKNIWEILCCVERAYRYSYAIKTKFIHYLYSVLLSVDGQQTVN